MPYGYDELEAGYGGGGNIENAPDLDGQDGACPPQILSYRVYPEMNFDAMFGQPPTTVDF